MPEFITWVLYVAGALIVLVLVGGPVALAKFYKKVAQGTALIRNGLGGAQVSFTGLMVVPIAHRCEWIDLSVKQIEIYRHGSEGLICKDNLRADIKVVFFIRVNNQPQDVLEVAQTIGCERASQRQTLSDLFDGKFSEGLKTVGKQFDFVELYDQRDKFKEEVTKAIGKDLNGYILDDCAIDYLEQTPLEKLDPQNILDSEGIKKIINLTANQQVLANDITRNKEKVIRKQDVEAREAILELDRQLAEAEERQKKEVASVKAREQAEAFKVQQEERQKAEEARIAAEETILVAEENKKRQVIVAEMSKNRTSAVETERVEKDRQLEATERDRIVSLAQIDR
ncbi:MAG: flotillin family protein, partial [Planctomycetales bacterium]